MASQTAPAGEIMKRTVPTEDVMKVSRIALTGAAIVVAAVILAPAVTLAQDESHNQTSRTNVLLTFRMGTFEDDRRDVKKSYQLVVAEGPVGSKLLSGQRVAFPTTSGDASQVYVYQNIGFSTEVRVRLIDKKTIKVVANIEDSVVNRDETGAPPSVETRQLSVNVVLTDGEPLELTRVEGILDDSGFVEIVAEILE